MIRMIQSKSEGHAKAYFSDALSKSDYYTNDQELTGRWQGKLADRLGLGGDTDKEAFFALCENIHPQTGQHLTPRTKDNRTTGYDINFHCPKSVSVMHMLAGDDHILKAFEESVNETMTVIEQDSKTRVRIKGKSEDRNTGELAWGHFIHQTARPVDGSAPDPHLHSHCFVFNATWDETEQKFKAAQFRDIKRDMPYYQARFQKTLSDKLMDLGYSIRATEKSFEIENVPQKVIDCFSKRTDQIGRVANEKGITDEKERSEIGARTRSKKQKGYDMKTLKKLWKQQILDLGADASDDGLKHLRNTKPAAMPSLTPGECINHALLHSFERSSTLNERRLLECAYKHSIGYRGATNETIDRAFNQDDRVLRIKDNGNTVCTTKEVLAEEKRMVDLAREGKGKMIPLYAQAPEISLQGQQGEAVKHILTTPNRVSIIKGSAGTGKTTLMKETVNLIEAAGKKVTVVAPTSQASRGVLREEGFKEATTVATLLVDTKMQEALKGQVLWVDEAGLLGTKDMKAILEIAKAQDARVILGGDTRQHSSVVRGDALRILNTVAKIETAEVSKIFRQKDEQYRSAVEDLSKGNVASAFEKLDKIGFIKDIDPLQPNRELVDDYVAAIQKGKRALILSPTHAQGKAVTKEVREKLKELGLLAKKESEVLQYTSLDFTAAEKQDSRNFREGQIIQFNQNAPGFARGSMWHVQDIKDGNIEVKDTKGKTQQLPENIGDRYDVFEESKLPLAKGDMVRITRNSFDEDKRRLNNGDMLKVTAIDKSGTVHLSNSISKATYSIDKNFGHIAHAHCITSHASQGKTVDEVFISQPAATFPATDAKQFYVSVSRGKERAHIYTDNKEELLHHASEMGFRLSAMELENRYTNHIDYVHQHQREENTKTTKSKQPVKSKFMEAHEPEI